MNKSIATGALLSLALALSACGKPAEEKPADSAPAAATSETAAAPAAEATTADAGGKPAVFGQCAACHAVEPGKNGVGPSLAGIVGRKAGSVAGFAYSDANKNSGLTWDEKTLDTYLTNPMKMVPGTKMTYAGLADAAKRKELIEYLKTLK
ncbi:cytochrome c family protein [Novosphingobium sp.]|uniref:c-type cytochrome n=1 Tax=Novosphingobium sp. TaxID=1874826 RepID=UPI0025E84498|nr:cytochrome c family protein [Novosphingobium sp.]MCC6927328.1 cytochrome c family protein [Novosphingobium sp.]